MLEEENVTEMERLPEIPSINEITLQRAEESRMIFEQETSHMVDNNTVSSYSEGFDVNAEDLNNVSFASENPNGNQTTESTEEQKDSIMN